MLAIIIIKIQLFTTLLLPRKCAIFVFCGIFAVSYKKNDYLKAV